MIRLLARGGILLGSNAVGLIVASLVLSGSATSTSPSFIIAVVIFTVVLR